MIISMNPYKIGMSNSGVPCRYSINAVLFLQVPGYPEWYNVKYDGDDSIYSYQLQVDYAAGDRQIIVR